MLTMQRIFLSQIGNAYIVKLGWQAYKVINTNIILSLNFAVRHWNHLDRDATVDKIFTVLKLEEPTVNWGFPSSLEVLKA